MSKKDETAEKKVKKSTKGIPRVTDKVLAMSPEDQKSWLDESCKALSAEVKAEVKARMEKAMKDGREPKKINFATAFKGRTVAELTEAQTALTSALAEASESEEKKLADMIANLQAQHEAIVKAKAEKATVTA